MSNIQHTAQGPSIIGTAVGAFLTLVETSPSLPRNYQKVAVTGNSPASGFSWLHNLDSGSVGQVGNGQGVESSSSQSLSPMVDVQARVGFTGLSSTAVALSAMTVGDLFINGSGQLARKVDVNGVSPPANNSWVVVLATGQVDPVLSATAFSRVAGSPVTWLP